MSASKSVLLVGFGVLPTETAMPGLTDESLVKMIHDSAQKGRDAGMDFDVILFKLQEFDEVFEKIKTALASKKYDGFIVGNGVRRDAQFTVIFEKLVNASRELSPATKLIFNTRPDDGHLAAQRSFGIAN